MHRLLEALGGTAMAEVREELGIVGYTLEQRDVVGGRGRGRGGFGPTSFFFGRKRGFLGGGLHLPARVGSSAYLPHKDGGDVDAVILAKSQVEASVALPRLLEALSRHEPLQGVAMWYVQAVAWPGDPSCSHSMYLLLARAECRLRDVLFLSHQGCARERVHRSSLRTWLCGERYITHFNHTAHSSFPGGRHHSASNFVSNFAGFCG